MLDQEDDGTRIGVWVALGVVAFVLFGLIGGLAIRSLKPATATTMTATDANATMPSLSLSAMAEAADAVQDVPLSGEMIGKVYFEVGQADLGADAQATLQAAADAVAAAPSAQVLVAGFHDATGDPAMNAELAKNRAKAVRDALKAAGVDAAAIVLRKPESTTGDGADAEARRVEMRLVK